MPPLDQTLNQINLFSTQVLDHKFHIQPLQNPQKLASPKKSYWTTLGLSLGLLSWIFLFILFSVLFFTMHVFRITVSAISLLFVIWNPELVRRPARISELFWLAEQPYVSM